MEVQDCSNSCEHRRKGGERQLAGSGGVGAPRGKRIRFRLRLRTLLLSAAFTAPDYVIFPVKFG